MTTVTRIHGSQTTVGTLYNNNCNLYLITVKNSSNTAIDLQTEDSSTVVYGVIEALVDEISPLAYITPAAGSGLIYVVMDKSIDSASELQHRIRNIGLISIGVNAGKTAIGPHTIDISGTIVTAATSFTVA